MNMSNGLLGAGLLDCWPEEKGLGTMLSRSSFRPAAQRPAVQQPGLLPAAQSPAAQQPGFWPAAQRPAVR